MSLRKSKTVLSALLAGMLCQPAGAQVAPTQVTRSIQILPVPPFDLVNDLILGGQARTIPESGGGGNLRIQVIVGCYGRNLRSVRNSISPESEIKMGLGLGPLPGLPVEVTFPGWIVKDGFGYGMEAGALQGAFAGPNNNYDVNPVFGLDHLPLLFNPGPPANNVLSAVAYGNVIQILTTIPSANLIAFSAQGGFNPSNKNNVISYMNFIQNLIHSADPANSCMNEEPDTEKKNWREATASWIGKNLFPRAQAGGDGGFPAGVDGGGDGSSAYYKNFGPNYVNSPTVQWVTTNPGPGTPWTGKCENRVKRPRPGKKRQKDGNMYLGMDGPINFQYISHWSSNFGSLELYVSFPGEDKFCGGYFSPLMLFPDSQRPRFTGRSDMMNRPDPGYSAWVEPQAPGQFLALDRNHNGRIDDSTELFGEDELAPNGFEKLRQHDLNRDGVIDRRDAIFSSLLLFGDRNGNGRSDPGEVTLAGTDGLLSISLHYQGNDVRDYARGLVQSREHSSYRFRDRVSGKVRNGEIIDVWFGRR